MVRGGSWNNNARNSRVAYRNNNHPNNRNDNISFRSVVRPSTPKWSQKLQAGILTFTEIRSVLEGVQINHPGPARDGGPKSAIPRLSLVICLRRMSEMGGIFLREMESKRGPVRRQGLMTSSASSAANFFNERLIKV